MRGITVHDTPDDSFDEAATTVSPAYSEDIHIRNYDVERAYRVTVDVADGADKVFSETYWLRSGAFLSEIDEIDPGEYEVTVDIDNGRSVTRTCQVDADLDHTVLIELGNGIVSVTQGVYR